MNFFILNYDYELSKAQLFHNYFRDEMLADTLWHISTMFNDDHIPC